MDKTAYEVTAANHYFWQQLVVLADDENDAFRLFLEYLASHEQQVAEEEEYEMGVDNDPKDFPERETYNYRFRDTDIKEFDGDHRWIGTPTAEVQVMHSDGNG